MEKIRVLMYIVVFWFLLGFFLSFILQDEVLLYGGELTTNYSDSGTDFINQTTAEGDNNPAGKSGITEALTLMFGFQIPEGIGIPSPVIVTIRFVNWFLILLSGVLLYRILNPLAGT